MAILPVVQILTDALPETGEVPYTEFVETLRASGKGRSLDGFHEARRSGKLHAGFREGVYVVSRFPIARDPRRNAANSDGSARE